MTSGGPFWRGIAWRGEPGEPADAVVVLPAEYADRYQATYRILFDGSSSPAILSLMVRDHTTDATVVLNGDQVTLNAHIGATVAYRTTLWRDALAIRGLAQRQAGGAPRGTGLTVPALVDRVLALREPDGTWPTQEAVAESLDRSVKRVQDVAAETIADGASRTPWERIIALAEERGR
jgi:hypothetical protein